MTKKQTDGTNVAQKMIIALLLGIAVGVVCMLLRGFLIDNGHASAWMILDKLFFADITQKIIQQLWDFSI